MGFIHRRLLKLVLAVVHRPKFTLFVAAMLLLASLVLAITSLKISSDQNKLFSSKVGFFHDYLGFIEKFPENEAVYVLVEAKDPKHPPPVEAWTSIADRLAHQLSQLHQYVQAVDAKVPLNKLGVQGLLFEDPSLLRDDFAEIKQFGQLAKVWGQNGLFERILGRTPTGRFLSALGLTRPDQQTMSFLDTLARSWVSTLKTNDQRLEIGEQVPDLSMLGATDPSRLGYYYVPDESDPSQHLLLVRVYAKTNYNSLTAITRTVEGIRSTVQSVSRDYPQFTVGMTGRPVLDADEMRTTDHDTHNAEIVALSVVFVAMAIMLRSVWLALVAEISLAVGIGWTFGWATISVGELNLLSIVFVIALIGIGMDYLVQILSRYRREARRYVRPAAVWARVFRYVSPPIFTACLGAAGAFFVSLLTDFRGAAELGIIAGGGLLLCLLSGYTVLPAILVLLPARIKPLHTSLRYRPPTVRRRHPAWRLLLPAMWIGGLIACIPFAAKTQFNPNLLELQAPNLRSVQLVRKVKTWFAVVLSKDLDLLSRVRDAVEPLGSVAHTESILDAKDNYRWLMQHKSELPKINWTDPAAIEPRDLTTLAEKSALLASHIEHTFKPTSDSAQADKTHTIQALRDFTAFLRKVPENQRDAVARRLTEWQHIFVAEVREMFKQFSPPPLNIQAVPKELRAHFISADGTYALYIYPKKDLWNRDALSQFVKAVETRVAQVPGAPPVTGIAPNIYHSTASIERAFYKATFYALALIFILVFLDLKRIGPTLLAVSVLALGLPMLVAIMGLLRTLAEHGIISASASQFDWNFANFFGLPILIGAGHEYGVFMMHRYLEVQHNPRRVWSRWDVSDRALLLCAFITSSSFGFFFALGHHRGLMSLGLVMALGTGCIYLATIMVLRPILRWRIDRKKFYHRAFDLPERPSADDE